MRYLSLAEKVDQDQNYSVGACHFIDSQKKATIMIAQAEVAPKRCQFRTTQSYGTENRTSRSDYAALTVDDSGRICACGTAVEDIFGAGQSQLLGQPISAFVTDFFRRVSSPRCNTSYLAHLCADNNWRQFQAKDARGRGFAVDIKCSLMMTNGQEVLLLNLRRPRGDMSSIAG